jgi:hypothetical protein
MKPTSELARVFAVKVQNPKSYMSVAPKALTEAESKRQGYNLC